MKALTVQELIDILAAYPKDTPVVYGLYSEYTLLQADQIGTQQLQQPRPDGWVHDARPDKPTITYLVFPGN